MASICDFVKHTFEFFSFLKANIWRGLRCHIIFFVSVYSLPWGLPKVAKRFVWILRLLEIFELENNSPGSFMHFQVMTYKKLQISRKSLSIYFSESPYHRLFKKYKLDLWCCVMLEKYSLKVAVFIH